jgi:hypothetical protein
MAPLPEGDTDDLLVGFDADSVTEELPELGGAFAQPAAFEGLQFDDEPEPSGRDEDEPGAPAQRFAPPRAASRAGAAGVQGQAG